MKMNNDNLKKEFEKARKAEFDLTDTLNKHENIPIDEILKDDLENNLNEYGMHIEYIPESVAYMEIVPYDKEEIKDLVEEYKSYIMKFPSKIEYYLTEFAKDLLDIDENEED